MGLGRVFENRCPVNDIYTYVVVFFFFYLLYWNSEFAVENGLKKNAFGRVVEYISLLTHCSRATHTIYAWSAVCALKTGFNGL